MWVRAVTAALAAWCVSGAALAAGYAEVWNPPEAAGHPAKHGKMEKVSAPVRSHAGANGKAKSPPPAKHGVKVAAKPGAKPGVHGEPKKTAGKEKPKAPVVAQAKKQPHVTRAGTSNHARPTMTQVSVAPRPAKTPAGATNDAAHSSKSSATTTPAANNPATASSGSLPPILH